MQNLESYIPTITSWALNFAPRLIAALLALFIGFFIVKHIKRILQLSLSKAGVEVGLLGFLISFSDIGLKCIVLLIVASIIGIKLTALFGVLAAAGFAIGLALQGFLGNFASGLTILLFKPYKIGDWVTVSDHFGRVTQIQIFYTLLETPNKKMLVIPNGQVTDNIITNYSSQEYMRLELEILVSYKENFPVVERIIHDTLQDIDYIVDPHDAHVGIESFDSHNIIVGIRPLIKPDDYWPATYAVYAAIKKTLHENNISFAYSEGIEFGEIGA